MTEFDLHETDQTLLVSCCEMLDRAETARILIEAEGLTFRDRFGQAKSHPAVEIERASHLTFIRLRREIGLDVEPPDSRPPLPRGYK